MITIVIRNIDRVRLYQSYGPYPESQGFTSALVTADQHIDSWGLEKKSSKYCTTFAKRLGIGASSTSIAVKFFPVHLKSGIAIDFTPKKLTDEHWDCFRSMLDKLFDGGHQKVFDDFKVTKLEVVFDVKVPFDEIICIAPGVGVENLHYLAKGTRYLGHKGGNRTYCIYDKRKQLADKVKVDLGHDRTRIEVRLRHLKKTIGEMASVKKPFGELIAIRKKSLLQLCHLYPDDKVLQTFAADVSVGVSPHAAYLKLEKLHKKNLAARLRSGALNLNGKAGQWETWIEQQAKQVIEKFHG